jgi:hypothetical protein
LFSSLFISFVLLAAVTDKTSCKNKELNFTKSSSAGSYELIFLKLQAALEKGVTYTYFQQSNAYDVLCCIQTDLGQEGSGLLVCEAMHGELFNCVDRFTAPRFTATSAPPAAIRIRLLPMNQNA